jgi:hypothetical protein
MSVQGLIICGANCDGYKPTASDPLAQYKCPYSEVHTEEDYRRLKKSVYLECYDPRPIDQDVVDEIEELERFERLESVVKRFWRPDS